MITLTRIAAKSIKIHIIKKDFLTIGPVIISGSGKLLEAGWWNNRFL